MPGSARSPTPISTAIFDRNPDQVTLLRRARPPPRRAARQLARRAQGLAGQGRRLAGAGEADRPGGHRRRPAARHLRDRPRGARGVDRRSASAATSSGPSARWSTAGRCRTATWSRFSRSGPTRRATRRWRAGAGCRSYIDTEIANLREGLKAGYSAPKGNVRIVIDQMDTLIATPTAESPFDSPSVRDKTPEFAQAVRRCWCGSRSCRRSSATATFCEKEYLPAAREAIARVGQPERRRLLRRVGPLPQLAADAGERGARDRPAQVEQLDAEMKAIGERSFAHRRRADAAAARAHREAYLFKSRDGADRVFAGGAGARQGRIHDWFGLLPKADVVIEPYPKFREKNGPNEYNPPAEDGSRPAVFFINAYQAEKKSRVEAESTAFHETIPGHHLQGAIALERKEIHPIGRYLGNAGYQEGWALYAERLADEMKLFSTDLDRLGMLSSQALRAVAARRRLRASTRSAGRASRRSTTCSRTPPRTRTTWRRKSIATSSIPGQATAYMLGKLEISKARDEAQQAMGPKFDIKQLPRSRARGRRDPGAASCTRRSTAGHRRNDQRIIGAGVIAAAMAASPIAVRRLRCRLGLPRRRQRPTPRSTCRKRRSPSCRRRWRPAR